MLVLTRKPGEALMLSDEMKITVLEVKGKQVRLGIEAPSDVPVHREEIYQRIEAERAGTKVGVAEELAVVASTAEG